MHPWPLKAARPLRKAPQVGHTLNDDLRDTPVQASLLKRIAGHEDGAVTFSIYGSRTPLKAMLEALVQITLHDELGH
ncbi:hypothetical protein PpSQ1_07275 [Pseudomonas putida]|nr:hypothetical protein PpSQ1_07275 [Pseudomonas putida]